MEMGELKGSSQGKYKWDIIVRRRLKGARERFLRVCILTGCGGDGEGAGRDTARQRRIVVNVKFKQVK